MDHQTNTAFLFPGLNGLFKRSDRLRYADLPQCATLFARAENVLRSGFKMDISLREFIDRPAEEIYRVENVSIAAVTIVCLQTAVAQSLAERIGNPQWVMGCSLGDLGRSVFADAYGFEDAIYNHVYFTLSIDGIDKIGANIGVLASKERPFQEEDFAWFEEVEVDVSRLTPRFLNIGGRYSELQKVQDAAREKGWNVMRLLNYPAHSRYILPFVEKVRTDALRVRVNKPEIPMFSSFSVRPLEDPDDIKREFLFSITMPIHWHVAVQALVESHGVTRFINIGPCKSLSGLMRDIPVSAQMVEASDFLPASAIV